MVFYADTCILLSLFFRDTGTQAALEWIQAAGSEIITVSPWTRTEFASAAAILARRGDITAELHNEGLARFGRFVDTRLSMEPIANADFVRATGWISDYKTGLPAGDALHLAVCARINAHLCTADETLISSASTVGVGVRRVA